MKQFVLHILLTSLLLLNGMIIAQTESVFDSGKEAYKEGNYQEAINNWSAIIDKGEHSAALYFNLGNAHYKLNNIGPSIYYYEKALQLNPYDSDIKNNLAFAENARVDAIQPLPQTVFKTWYKKITGLLSYDGWAIAAVVCIMLFVLLFLMYYYATSERRKRLLFAASFIAVFFFVFTLSVAFLTNADAKRDKPAIIYSESVEVMDSPALNGEVSYIIHEGTKVQLKEWDGDWVRIQLADGKDGWVPLSDLKEL